MNAIALISFEQLLWNNVACVVEQNLNDKEKIMHLINNCKKQR